MKGAHSNCQRDRLDLFENYYNRASSEMDDKKIKKFMALAGQETQLSITMGTLEKRKLGAQLLLSETLEYVIKGLGITPIVNGQPITDPNALVYEAGDREPEGLEMIDGLADVAYTMYWNECAFGIPLEEAFEAVCDNNLEKFVKLVDWNGPVRSLEQSEWHCNKNISWPDSVVEVTVISFCNEFYAVGKDISGKVRKPSSYCSVDLTPLLGK
ncbi:MAG: hypothetical protein KDD42_07965 [Bdellovibrionales bacterium]|nr:hypothetical protein [Bdellovibrionales bacterium]